MKPNEIKAALVLVETTQTAVAKGLGISQKSVNEVITGGRRTRRIQEAISLAISKLPWDVFPDYPNPHVKTM